MRATSVVILALGAAACSGKGAASKETRRVYVTTSDSTVLLPLSLRETVAAVPGVVSVVPEVPVPWPDSGSSVWGIATDAAAITGGQPSVLGLSEEDAARWVRDPDGIVVSRALASRKGWSVGDSIGLVLASRSAQRAAVAEVDRFTVRGIVTADAGESFAIHLATWRTISGTVDDAVPLFVVAVKGAPEAMVEAISQAAQAQAPQARAMLGDDGASPAGAPR